MKKTIIFVVLFLSLQGCGFCERDTGGIKIEDGYIWATHENKTMIIGAEALIAWSEIISKVQYDGEVYVYLPKSYSGNCEPVWHWKKFEKDNIIEKHYGEVKMKLYCSPTPGGTTHEIWVPENRIIFYPTADEGYEVQRKVIEGLVNELG